MIIFRQLFTDFRFTEKSIDNAKKFTLNCHRLVNPESLLWISFQSNCVAEVVNENEHFKDSLEKMIVELQENNFHFANLHANMRNSGPISKISLDSASKTFNLAKHVPLLNAAVPGPNPRVLPVRDDEFKYNPRKILDHALKTTSGNRKLLLLHDGKFFSNTELKQHLDQLNTHDLVRIFDSEIQGQKGCTDELLNFMQSSEKEILVSHQDFVTGIETPSVCFIMSDLSIDSASLRCTVFRAVENVLVIHPFSVGRTTFTTLRGFEVDPSLLQCAKRINLDDHYLKKRLREGKDDAHLCLCKFCFYACQHEIAEASNVEWDKRDNYPINCQCNNNGQCKIYHL